VKQTAISVVITLAFSATMQSTPAQAQLSHTAVSAVRGRDANNCSVTRPCRTFQAAHNRTNDQGEITVLDPGDYGAVTITKSISIVNGGVGEASILVSGGATGITINAGASGSVNLRGITIQGIASGGGTGLRFNSGLHLTMTNCVIRNHTADGLEFAPTDLNRHNLSISNTLVAENGAHGIHVHSTSGGEPRIKATFNRVEVYGNSRDGIFLNGSSSAALIAGTAEATVSAGNGQSGFSIDAELSLAAVSLIVVRSVSSSNHFGFNASGAFILVGQSTVVDNQAGASTGNVVSFGDNYSVNNAGSGDGFSATRGKN